MASKKVSHLTAIGTISLSNIHTDISPSSPSLCRSLSGWRWPTLTQRSLCRHRPDWFWRLEMISDKTWSHWGCSLSLKRWAFIGRIWPLLSLSLSAVVGGGRSRLSSHPLWLHCHWSRHWLHWGCKERSNHRRGSLLYYSLYNRMTHCTPLISTHPPSTSRSSPFHLSFARCQVWTTNQSCWIGSSLTRRSEEEIVLNLILHLLQHCAGGMWRLLW